MFDQLFQQLTQTIDQIIGVFLAFIFDLVWITTSLSWTFLARPLAYIGYVIEVLNHLLASAVFAPLIGQLGGSLATAVNFAWVIALFVLGMCYLLAAFAQIRVVSPKAVFVWYLVALAFFQVGPSLYSTMDAFRGSIQGMFYGSVLTYFQSSQLANLNLQNTSSGVSALGLTTLCDNFGSYLGNPVNYFGGLDVALAFLRADGYDVMGYLPKTGNAECATSSPMPNFAWSLPRSWYDPGSFFDATQAPVSSTSNFFNLTTDQQGQVIANAVSGLLRLVAGIPLLIFGVLEQVVALCLTIAEGLTFLSFAVALLFAFFKRTEPIALAIIDQWIALIVQTVIIALLQAIIVGFLVVVSLAGNAIVAAAVAIIGLIIEFVIIKSALKAITRTFDGLFNAFGQATGGTIGSLSGGVQDVAGVATGGLSLAGAGVGGALALAGGASGMQAAGVVLGDSGALTGAARMLTRLPGAPATDWGKGATEFVEGAAFRQIGDALAGDVAGPPLGGYLAGRFLGKRQNKGGNDDERDTGDGGHPGTTPPGGGSPQARYPRIPMRVTADSDEAVDAEIVSEETRLTRRQQRPIRVSATPDNVIDAEILPGDDLPALRPSRPAEGLFQPAFPPKLLSPGSTLTPTDGGSNVPPLVTPDNFIEGEVVVDPQLAAPRIRELGPGAADSALVPAVEAGENTLADTIDADERRLERTDNDESDRERATADADAAQLAATDTADVAQLAREEQADTDVEIAAEAEEIGVVGSAVSAGQVRAAQTDSAALVGAAGQLSAAAADLSKAAQRADSMQRREQTEQRLAQAEGTLSIAGSGNVAAVLANLVDSLRAAIPSGNSTADKAALPDFLTVAQTTAQVSGLTPVDTRPPLAGGDLASVGLFTKQALGMGLSGDAVEDVVRQVRQSPDGQLTSDTRRQLTRGLVEDLGYSERSAAEQVETLERRAQVLPSQLNMYGQRTVVVAPNGNLAAPAAAQGVSTPPVTSGAVEQGMPMRETAGMPQSTPMPRNNPVQVTVVQRAVPLTPGMLVTPPLVPNAQPAKVDLASAGDVPLASAPSTPNASADSFGHLRSALDSQAGLSHLRRLRALTEHSDREENDHDHSND
ncbi:MAG: hypothetical protein ACYDBJ_10020 [Aggregatilineales bacterium]